MATEEQICSSYQFYLQIMKKAGAHKEIDQKPTLKFLTYLAENADIIDDSTWKLGHGILDICRNIVMCHGTHMCFLDDEILKKPYQKNKSYATLSFIISAAFVLPALTLLGRALHKINNHKIQAFQHHLAFYTWLLVVCMLTCILNILNLFDNFINDDQQKKSGKTCYYIYVLDGTFLAFVGICLLCLTVDITRTVLSKSEHLADIGHRKLRVHILSLFFTILCFIINNLPHIVEGVNFQTLNKCWKGNAYEGHVDLAAKIDLAVQAFIILTTGFFILFCAFLVKYKTRSKELLIVPEYMKVMENEATEHVEQMEQEVSNNFSTDTPSSDIPAKLDKAGNIYKKYEHENRIEEKQHLKRQKSAMKQKKKSTHDRGAESSSKESSCHENTGYISEGNEDIRRQSSVRVTSVHLQQPRFYSSRRRFKSDSEIQEPRQETYIEVCKPRKQTSRKVLEEQVFEALESFFVADPGKMLFRALGSQKQCELNIHLIDDKDDEKAFEEETCFNESGAKSAEIKRKKRLSPLRKVKSLKGISSSRDVSFRDRWTSYKEQFQSEKSSSRLDMNPSKGSLDLIQFKSQAEQSVAKSSVNKVVNLEKSPASCRLTDSSPADCLSPADSLNKPDIVIENEMKENGNLNAQTNINLDSNKNAFLSVNVDVHCSDHSQSVSSVDTVATEDEDRMNNKSGRNSDLSLERTSNPGCWITFASHTNNSGKPGGKVKWEDEVVEDSCFDKEAAKEESSRTKADNVRTDSVLFSIDSETTVDISVNAGIENDLDIDRKDENCVKTDRSANTSIEVVADHAEEKKKELFLTFKEYHKNYLLKPYKNVLNLLLVYVVGVLPQIVLDIYRIVQGNSVTIYDNVDGILSICSDASMSVFLLGLTVMFLWRFRNRRTEKSENIV